MVANTVIWAFFFVVLISMFVVDNKDPTPPPAIPLTSNPQLADCIYTTAQPYKNGTTFPVIRCPNSVVIIDDRPSY